LTWRVDPEIPELLMIDTPAVLKALHRIGENAVKFTDRGSVEISADRLETMGDKTWIRFSIKDTGVGIPADRIDRLFEDLTQADGSITRRFGGIGLGLTMARKLTEALGGRLRAESVEGRGSAFHIELPFKNV
jgi:signal transduction histidine kinase